MADVDTSFYPRAPQGNPLLETAGSAIGVANAAQQNRLLQQQEQAQGIDIGLQQLGILRSAMGAIAANPNASYDDFAGLGALVDQGLINPEFYASELAKVPKNAAPDVYRGLANQYNAQLATVGERYSMQTGIPLGTAGQAVTFTNEAGAPVTTGAGGLAERFGGAGFPVGPGGENPLMGQPQSGAVQNPFVQGAAPAGPELPMPSPGQIVAPTPQQQAAWNASTEQFNEDRASAASWNTRKLPLEKLIDLLPKTLTGKGSDIVTDLAKVASTFGIDVAGAEDQADFYNQIEKYSAQLARMSGAAANSDAQLAAAITATPGAAMDNLAAQDVTKVLLSLERFQQAKVLMAEQLGIPPQRYADFAREWGASFDPRGFAVDLMDGKARDALLAEIDKASPEEQARFWSSLEIADQLRL